MSKTPATSGLSSGWHRSGPIKGTITTGPTYTSVEDNIFGVDTDIVATLSRIQVEHGLSTKDIKAILKALDAKLTKRNT